MHTPRNRPSHAGPKIAALHLGREEHSQKIVDIFEDPIFVVGQLLRDDAATISEKKWPANVGSCLVSTKINLGCALDTKGLIFGHFDRDDRPMISEKNKWQKSGL